MKRVTALGATLALLLAPVLVRLLKAQSPPQGSAATFTVSPPAVAYVGSVFNLSVTAFDPSSNAAKSYTGTVHFTSTDSQAVLPPDYTFTTGDSGTHMFSATLNTPGTQTITATDTANGAITGTSNSLTVSATPPLPPPTFTLTDLGPLGITAAPSGATAFNASGQVTGFRFENFASPVCFAGGANRAFLWNNGTYTELGTLGGASGFGYGINNAGQIVGGADICVNGSFSAQRAFIWQNGTMTPLDPSTDPNSYSSAFAINTNGSVAGYINNLNNSGIYQPVIWKGGTAAGLMVLAPLGCQFAPNCQGKAFAINDAGQAAGWNYGATVRGYTHAVMWDTNGQPTDLGSFGRYFNDQANAINSKGDVVGYSQLDPDVYYSIVRAVVWQNGNPQNPQDLGTIPGIDPVFGSGVNITDNSSSAWGINSKGEIVGISADSSGAVTLGNGGRAFLYIPTPAPGTGGQVYDLLSLLAPGTNWRQLQAAWAINDNGQILGVGIDPNQQEHGFLLTPIITPTTTALSTSGTPSVFGQSVSFTATVTPTPPNANAVNDTVTFYDGNTSLGTGTYNGNGVWIFNSALLVGNRSITASYSGDNNFGPSTSPVLSQTVNQAATTTTLLSVSPNPASLGQTVTLTAQVTVVAPGLGTPIGPSGPVTFYDNGTALTCSPGNQSLSGGQATCQYAFTTQGSHPLTASYAGDTNFTGSTTSQGVTLNVVGLPPVPNLTVTPASLTFNYQLGGMAPPAQTVSVDTSNGSAVTYNLTTSTIPAGGSWLPAILITGTTPSRQTVSMNTAGLVAGTYNGSVSLVSSAVGNSPLTVPVTLNVISPPPPVQIVDNETITVTDAASFPDVFDGETVRVADAVWITPLIKVAAPVAEFSAGALGFSGQSGSQTITVSDIGLASLTLTSATISGSSQFAVTQISCTNSATSLSTVLPSGGVCAVMINYTASATPVNDNDVLTFTDNAALSNLPTVASGSNYTQSIPLSGSGSSTPPPPPPPAVVPVMDNETVSVTDTVSFPDVFDAEAVHVADAVFVTPLIQVSAPVAEFSAGSLGFSGQSGSQTITVSDIGLASLTLTSATISGSSQFAVTQISCTNSATSLSTVLPSGGVCAVTIGYTASGTPANDNATLVFTDNAALSNVVSTPAGSSYTQSIPLNGSGTTTAPPPPPPAVVPLMDNETIHVADTESFPDIFDAEAVKVTDAIFVTPLIQVSAPVAEFSAGSLGFGGQSGSQTITVSDIGTGSLMVASATASGSSQFSITQVACSNSSTSVSTTLPSGGACILMIGYSASATPANDNGSLLFTDNAGLSNVASVPAGSSYTQSIPLSGGGSTTAPPPPPPAVVTIPPILETIKVTDTPSFPDVSDSEHITVTDQVSIQPLNSTTTSITITGGNVYGTPTNVMVSVGSSTAAVTGNVTLSLDGGAATTLSLTSGSATSNLGILKAGNHSLSANFAAQGNLLASSAQTTFVVNPATPAITWTNPSAIILGTALSAAQLNATASVPGAFAYNPPAGTLLTAGSHLLSVTFTPADAVDYTTAKASVTITVLNTGVGTGINVTPVDTTTGTTPVTLSFTNVTTAGNTGLTTSSSGPAVPAGFQPGVPLVYYNLTTSATFSGTAAICINYTGVTFPNTGAPQLFHYQNGVWTNITTNVNTVNLVACGATASLSPFALFAPLPVLTITANSFSRQYGAPDPTLTATYSGFVNGDTPASLSGTLTCSSTDTVSSPVGNYAITCSGLSSPKYVIRYAPGVLTVTPAPLAVTAGNAQRVYGASNPVFTGAITGIQNGDNISATYTTAATPASPVGTYAIVPALVDPTGKLGNYAVTKTNGTLTVIQASTTTTLNVSPNPSNFGQLVTLTATVAPVAPGAGTATGKVTFSDGNVALGTSTLSATDTATFTTSSLAAGKHNLIASYSGDANLSASSSSALSDQVICGVLISLSSPTVPLGGTITVTGKVISCATTTQTVVIQFSLSGPSQPNSCSSTKSVMFTTPPFPLPPKTSQTVAFPFKVPSGVCRGTYTITATTLVNGVAVNTSTASLTVT